MTLQELKLKLTADVSGAQKGLEEAGGHVNKLGGIIKGIIGAAAVTVMVSFGKSCINAAGEAQQGEVLLRSSLGNIKGMTDQAKDAAVDWVNKMEASKSFDDSEISAALQRMAIKTGDLSKAQELTNAAMEVARNKNVDLATATGLVDQAYNGSARALKTFGIEVGPDGKAVQGMAAIHALQEKVKGSGDAWAKTLEGQKAAMATTFGNFQEVIGGVLMPLATQLMKEIMPLLTKAMEWVTKHMPEIQRVITAMVQGISKAFEIGAKVINGVVETIKWIIEHAKQAVEWVKGVQGASDAALGGGGTASGKVIAPGGHAAGGWVGLNGPEVSLVGERGPEYITPNNQVVDQAGLLRDILQQLNVLTRVTAASPAAIGTAINGMGRGL